MPNSFTVFYSWQSELPNSTNRGFIQAALENAVEVVSKEVQIETRVDKDTQGLSGAPDIPSAILKKIDECDAFVCDLSFVNHGATFPDGKPCRLAPNANVLVELGYAIKVLGWDRIFLIVNEFYGPIRELPFDIERRRAKSYMLGPSDDKKTVRKSLETTTIDAVRAFVDMGKNSPALQPSLAQNAIAELHAQTPTAVRFVRQLWDDWIIRLQTFAPQYPTADPKLPELEVMLRASLEQSLAATREFAEVADAIALANDTKAAQVIYDGFKSILELYDPIRASQGQLNGLTCDADFYRFIGHEWFVIFIACLLRAERFETIGLLLERKWFYKSPGGMMDEEHEYNSITPHVILFSFGNRPIDQTHGALLKRREDSDLLKDIVGWQEFWEADYFLFSKGQLHSPYLDQGLPGIPYWIMLTILLVGELPSWAQHMRQTAVVRRWLPALGFSTIEDFKNQLSNRHNHLDPKKQVSGYGSWMTLKAELIAVD